MRGPWSRLRRARRERILVAAYGLVTIVFGLVVASSQQTVLDRFSAQVFDAYQRQWLRPEAGAPLLMVDVDEASIAALGQWPWPRSRLADMVDRLNALGAAAIVFDVVFPEADRTSPARIVAELERAGIRLEGSAAALAGDNDAALAEAFGRANVVAGIVVSNETAGALRPAKAGFAFGGSDPSGFLDPYRGGVANLPSLEAAATGIGFLSFPPSRDGIIRQIPLVSNVGGRLYPALSLEALRVAQGAGGIVVRTSTASGEIGAGTPTITAVKVGDLEVPTGPDGTLWIYFSGLPSVDRVSAAALLDPEAERLAALVEGRIVIVGTSAVGLRDLVSTPVAASMPGMYVHAEIIDQILAQTFLTRPDWAHGAETALAFLLGVALIVVVNRGSSSASAASAIGICAAVILASWLLFVRWRLLIDPVLPAVTVATVFAVTMPVLLLLRDREKKFVRSAFGHYLSPLLVERLAEDPSGLRLGGELRELTVLFSDIRNFTAISETLDPQALTALLNGVLTPMTDTLLNAEATIDKYMGDAIMAFWNAPLDVPDHRRKACLAALDMERRLAELNRPGQPALKAGIGLHTGPACVGNLGSSQRFSYSAIGDAVNLASRIEGLTKAYGLSILVSETVRDGAPDFAFLPVDRVRVVGRAEPVAIFVLLGDASMAATAGFQALKAPHERMTNAYLAADPAGLETALGALDALDAPPLRPLHALYRRRLEALRAQPIPADWTGIVDLQTK